MKGRSTFTSEEIDRIRTLLRQKAMAPAPAQKGIRAEMRSIGFFISDFGGGGGPFTEGDLDRLIRTGRISATGEGQPATPERGTWSTRLRAWWYRIIGRNRLGD